MHSLLATVTAQFTTKTTNSKKKIFILSLISYSINKPKVYMLFTSKIKVNCTRKTSCPQCLRPSSIGFLQMISLNKFAGYSLHKKWGFPLSISSLNVTKSAGNCDLVTFTEEILNGKLHFLCSDWLSPLSATEWFSENVNEKTEAYLRRCSFI